MLMPETPMDEDGPLPASENEIGVPIQVLRVKAVSVAERMDESSHHHFWACVFAMNLRHTPTSLFGRKGV
jgi:hypothetical protein